MRTIVIVALRRNQGARALLLLALALLVGCSGSSDQSGTSTSLTFTLPAPSAGSVAPPMPPPPPQGMTGWVETASPAFSTKDTGQLAASDTSTSMSLPAGWNLLTVPFTSVTSMTGLEGPLFAYDAADGRYSALSAEAASVGPGRGYWVYCESDASVGFDGAAAALGVQQGINVLRGWNLIGFPARSERSFEGMSISTEDGSRALASAVSSDPTGADGALLYRYVRLSSTYHQGITGWFPVPSAVSGV